MRAIFKWTGRFLTLITALVLLGGFVDPRDFWLPAVFGPGLPLLLFLTTALLVYLAYRRKWKEAVFPLSVILLAVPSWQKTIAFNSAKEALAADDVDRIGVITANLSSLKSPEDNYPINEAAVIKLAKRLSDQDFLLVQEYSYPTTDWRSSKLKKFGRYDYLMTPKEGRMGIFSRYPLTYVGEDFPHNSVNGYLVADVKTPQGTIRLINVHFLSNRVTGLANTISKEGKLRDGGTWDKVKNMFGRYGRASALRCEQAEDVAEIVAQSPHPCIVAGDFNDVPASYPYRILVDQTELQDSWIEAGVGLGRTFDGALPGLRIDYVLTDPAFSVHSVKREISGHSDHHPLRVEMMMTSK